MSDENNNPPPDSPPPAPPAAPIATPVTAPAEAKGFTQEQVNAIVAKRLSEDRARRGEPPPAAPAAAQPIAPTTVEVDQHMTPKQMKERLELLESRALFDKQALRRGVADEAADDLFDLFRAQKPSDIGKWFDDKAARLGFKGTPAAPTAATAATTAPLVPAPAAGPPISDKGSPAPGGITSYERELAENPVGMSAAAYALMVSKLGEEKARRTRIDAAMALQGNMRVTVK